MLLQPVDASAKQPRTANVSARTIDLGVFIGNTFRHLKSIRPVGIHPNLTCTCTYGDHEGDHEVIMKKLDAKRVFG